jgi:hypothetical protein
MLGDVPSALRTRKAEHDMAATVSNAATQVSLVDVSKNRYPCQASCCQHVAKDSFPGSDVEKTEFCALYASNL